jgi:hypothetical protein
MEHIQHIQLIKAHGPLVTPWLAERHTLDRTIFSYDLNNARLQHVHIQDHGRTHAHSTIIGRD